MSNSRLAAALVLSALVCLPFVLRRPGGSANAGSAPALDLVKVVHVAQQAFEGTVLEARGRVGSDGLIETEYRFAIDRRFIGDGGPSELLVLPGGVLPDGRGLAIPGVPTLNVGDETVLFLSDRDARTGRRMTVGLEQGRYRIVTDRGGQRVAVGQGPAFVAHVDGEPSHAALVSLPYQELRARIEAALQTRDEARGR